MVVCTGVGELHPEAGLSETTEGDSGQEGRHCQADPGGTQEGIE